MGYTVKQLDLVDLTSETKFNPMRYIDPTKPDVAIMRLVTNIMDNTNEEYGRLFVGMPVSALVLVSSYPVDAEVVVGEDLADRADGQWGETHAEADDDAHLQKSDGAASAKIEG